LEKVVFSLGCLPLFFQRSKMAKVELSKSGPRSGCRADFTRVIDQRPQSVGEMFAQEAPLLLPVHRQNLIRL